MNTFFAGLDWASQTHAVCLIDAHGTICEYFDIAHDAAGLAELRRRLTAAGSPPIAIERPSGLIVDTLIEAGFTVVPIHPNVVKAPRPRYRSHGAKSDASDAYLLADLLRTDGHRFQPLAPQGEDIRALGRGRDDLVATRVQLANQLRSLLDAFWPGAAAVVADVDSPIALALAFVERYPTPESAARLGLKRMAAFCAQHAYCGRRSPEALLARLHQAAPAACGELEMDAKGELAKSLAELGSVRERFDSDARLAAEGGVAPVTYPSGKSKAVTFRWACNHHLRAALTCLADNSRHASAWAAYIYAPARARGCDHPHAIRILARAWVRVLWRAWTDRKPYDPAPHHGVQLAFQAT